MNINKIRNLAAEITANGTKELVTIYLIEALEQEPSEIEINRTFSHPIGVSEENWPRLDGKKMFHAVTLDLETTPKLKEHFPGYRAISLFISDRVEHEIDGPNNKDATLVRITQEDIEEGINENSPEHNTDFGEPKSQSFTCHEIEIPIEVFHPEVRGLVEENPLLNLATRIYDQSYAAGVPLWLQGVEFKGTFLLQFDEMLVDMNLGDGGIMYVFKETAFFQCH